MLCSCGLETINLDFGAQSGENSFLTCISPLMTGLDRSANTERRSKRVAVFRSSCIILLLFSAFLISEALAQNSSALIRFSYQVPPEVTSIQTYAGAASVAVSPVRPAASRTVVLLLDTLTAASLDDIKTGVLSLYGSSQGHPLRLATLRQGSLSIAGPFTSQTGLQRALEKVGAVDPSAPASQASPAQLFDTLSADVAQLGSHWSRVLLIGDFPALDPASIDYASAILLRAFLAQQLRVSWYAPDGQNDAWLPLFLSTGGTIEGAGGEDFGLQIQETSQHFSRLDWTPTAPSAGFITSHSVLSGPAGGVLFEVPDLAASAAASLPTVEAYSEMQNKIAETAARLQGTEITVVNLQGIRDQLAAALAMNPLEPAALRLGLELYEKAGDYATAVKFAHSLTEVRPLDGSSYTALGHALWLGSELDKAETALRHAVELNVPAVLVAEDMARIRIALKDDKAAIPYLDQVLQAHGQRQDLWFLEAEVAGRLNDSPRAVLSLEQGLALGGLHIKETGDLIRLYLADKQNSKALELARRTTGNLPPDASVREEFAGVLDNLQQKTEAIDAWKRVLEVRQDSERAYYRIARLLLELGDAGGAERVAKEGVSAAPKSADLYIVEADALKKEGRMYDARGALEEGAMVVIDPDLLAHLAEVEDSYGGSAAAAYARLAESLKASSRERIEALERGFAVSVRDGDLKNAESFAVSLQSAGRPEFRSMLGAEAAPESGTLVPGGLDALAFVAHIGEGIPPERFFSEYAQRLIDGCGGLTCWKMVFEHFQRVAALEALGKRTGNSVVITLSLENKDTKHKTEKVLELLGIKLRMAKGQLELDRGEDKSQAKKQESVAALAVDEVGLQEQLQAGKSYDLEIRDEWVPVYPNEKMWRESLYPAEKAPGGFAGALSRVPKMSLLYRGLSGMNRKCISELLSAVNLRTLNDKYARLLYLYGPALALQGTHATVPGGTQAEALWAKLVGVSPVQPGPFFRALLEREDGRLLAFFSTLSGLDRPHQAFFTANFERTNHFYKLFAISGEMQQAGADSSFKDLLRSVPLDDKGHVDFPGSAEVWMVAKGHDSSDTKTTKLLRKASKAVAPDVEDEVLLHLAQTRYKDKSARHTELDNFLGVAHLDAHRTEPLGEESALLLAQRYSESSAAYSYFEDLTALDSGTFQQFFAAVDRIKTHSVMEANLQLGQLHSLIEWICLLRQREVIGDAEASKLFSYLCSRFVANDSYGSLESARRILAFCRQPGENISADEQIRRCLLGASGKDGSKSAIAFQRVLEMQKVPSLDTLFTIYNAATKLAANGTDSGEVAMLGTAIATIPSVDLPRGTKMTGKERECALRYHPAPMRKTVEELQQKAAKRKSNPHEIQKLSLELLAELEPQVTAGLTGPLYAYFLRPSDLVVSDDTLLLRKHRYFDFADKAQEHMIEESAFHGTSEGAGSYFRGGFGQFGLAAGSAAGVGWKTGGANAESAITAQIAAIRSTAWDHLEESDQRLVSLRITVAREWIFQSARDSRAFQDLSEETMGLLSLSRRADLLTGIESRAWRKVWDSVTLPDLFELGGQYLSHYKTAPWSSPVTAELSATAALNDGSRLSILGPIPYHSFGCGHPHLRLDAPYEEYERFLMADEIAERSAEFKLFLAYRADGGGVEPSVLGGVAEDLAAKAFRAAKMNDPRDWRSLLGAYSSISSSDVKEALKQ
jgi:tetratricopeptide (TPR) repeat protein